MNKNLLLAQLCLFLLWGCGGAKSPTSEANRARLLADHRVKELLGPCTQGGFYDRDLSDVVGILIEKLEHGKTEALKRAKEELGLLGADAVAELARIVDRNASDPMRGPMVENAMDAAGFNPSDPAREVLLKGLRHPQESVRRQALVGLRSERHARPEVFDALLERAEGFETPDLQRIAVQGMFAADHKRAESRVLNWVEEKLHQPLWSMALPLLVEATDPLVQARCAKLFEQVDPQFAPSLAAPAARGGDAEALDYLRGLLTENTPQNVRILCIQSLGQAKLYEELDGPAKDDPAEGIRVLAIDFLANAEGIENKIERISHGLDDPSASVRGLTLKHLVRLGSPDARARALTLLEEEGALLQQAVLALTGPMKEDPDLARLVWDRLLIKHQLEEHRPIQKRIDTYKAMGLVPLAKAALFLHELGARHSDEVVQRLAAHDWLMIQASNTGEPGRQALLELFPTVEDPLQRIGLIHAIGSAREEFARVGLSKLVEQGSLDPIELLFAASRLCLIGPTWEVAPVLKRACYAVEDLEIRRALQCLLWRWY